MSISREPLVEVVRAWDGVPGRSVRRGCVVVTWEFHDTVVLSAATGRLRRSDLFDLGRDLLDAGVRVVRAWRAKGHAVPCGHIVLHGEGYDLWEINLPAAMARANGAEGA